jgi:hypothetical protein
MVNLARWPALIVTVKSVGILIRSFALPLAIPLVPLMIVAGLPRAPSYFWLGRSIERPHSPTRTSTNAVIPQRSRASAPSSAIVTA